MKKLILNQEQKSILAVLRYERQQGRDPRNVSKEKIGWDVISGKRHIEVKSCPADNLPGYVALYGNLLKKLGKNVSHYYIYIVWNFGKNTKITILEPKDIFSSLEISSHYRIYRKCFYNIKPVSGGKL